MFADLAASANVSLRFIESSELRNICTYFYECGLSSTGTKESAISLFASVYEAKKAMSTASEDMVEFIGSNIKGKNHSFPVFLK